MPPVRGKGRDNLHIRVDSYNVKLCKPQYYFVIFLFYAQELVSIISMMTALCVLIID